MNVINMMIFHSYVSVLILTSHRVYRWNPAVLMFAPEASKHGNVMRVVIPKPAKERVGEGV